jgi:hypothetical protein
MLGEANFLDQESSLEITRRVARHATSDRCHAQRSAEAVSLAPIVSRTRNAGWGFRLTPADAPQGHTQHTRLSPSRARIGWGFRQ